MIQENVSLEEFEQEARSFLDAHASRRPESRTLVWGEGTDSVSLFDERTPERERNELAQAREWRATTFDAGFGWITGPAAYGGRQLPNAYDRLWSSLEPQYQVPHQAFFGIGLGMVAPTILAHGSATVKDRYLRQMHRGDVVGCQLFSEPGAGSDLASLQTRAERDGDEWRISGQKVWTSGAQYSDIGEVICRTDPDQPKHKGLTGFVVDMRAPGVEVRPLRQMTGGASFNEVFFNEVRVPDDHRLGEVNQGWSVALTTLMNERAAIGAGGAGGATGGVTARIIEMVRHYGLDTDPIVRNDLAALVSANRVASYTNQRAMDRIKQGQLPGPELSIAKLALTTNMRRMSEFVARVLGPRLIADSGEWGTYAWGAFVLGVPGMRIAGGSDEVMRNIVGERVLGLPKDPGIDSVTPFRELKVGTQTR
ncbi:MAG TPA: acyl-CoA dehydrogenase family protein [Actinomycetota bacterium]|nr:acyl-CoA dehydrogenase family protein [Actinomycetota bacterium]